MSTPVPPAGAPHPATRPAGRGEPERLLDLVVELVPEVAAHGEGRGRTEQHRDGQDQHDRREDQSRGEGSEDAHAEAGFST